MTYISIWPSRIEAQKLAMPASRPSEIESQNTAIAAEEEIEFTRKDKTIHITNFNSNLNILVNNVETMGNHQPLCDETL